jgi:hypothetical protein
VLWNEGMRSDEEQSCLDRKSEDKKKESATQLISFIPLPHAVWSIQVVPARTTDCYQICFRLAPIALGVQRASGCGKFSKLDLCLSDQCLAQ